MLSIIIPTKNEEQNIPLFISKIEKILQEINQKDYELIFIDDYSTDSTLALLTLYSEKDSRIRVIQKKFEKPGVGEAIKLGISTANGNLILTMDADLSHDPYSIPKFLENLNNNIDLIIGSRFVPKSEYNMPSPRYVISKLFNTILKIIFRIKIRDITSGFRLIKSSKLKALQIQSENFEIHPEINIKAALSHYHIKEIPITFDRRRLGISKLLYRSMLLKYLRLFYTLLSNYSRFRRI